MFMQNLQKGILVYQLHIYSSITVIGNIWLEVTLKTNTIRLIEFKHGPEAGININTVSY